MSRRRINIGILLTSFEAGGTESQMLQLAERLDRRTFAVHLACLNCRGPLLERAAQLQGSVTSFPLISFRHPRIVLDAARFARWCRRERLAIVHTAGLHANIFGLAGATLARVRVRVGSRRNLTSLGHSEALRCLQRRTYRLAHYVVANSAAAANALLQDGIRRAAIAIIPNGIDTAWRRAASTPGAPRVIVVANLRREKAHDVLVAAARHVLARRPDVVFQLVGEGPLRRDIQDAALRTGVASAFEFLGFRTDVPDLVAAAGVFALPSRTEALPNAIMEAMAAGVPVVATAVGGVPELIRHDREGLLVPPENPAALADSILSIILDRDRAERLGKAAREAIAKFTIHRMVEAHERLYVRALQRMAAGRT